MNFDMHPNTRVEPDSTPVFTISTAASLLGISVHTLRMYEREGFIVPHKKESGQRLYSSRDVHRIQCLRKTINEEKISMEGVKRILSLIPCWAIIDCPKTDRDECPAYNGAGEPCWSLRHKTNVCAGRSCRDCQVYSEFADCHSIKTKLKDLIL